MTRSKDITDAAPRACAHCPWRLSNQGRRHRHGFYAKANLRRLWAGLRSGAAPGMTCHPTDPDMAEFEGYEATATAKLTHECAGAVTLVAREVMRFQAICLDVDRDEKAGVPVGKAEARSRYRQAAPHGLTTGGMAEIVWRFIAGGSPLARAIKVTPDALNDPEVGYPPLGDWDPQILVRSQEAV